MSYGPAWLFCPADRPDRFEKASDIADVVILDLEDGVRPEHRASARAAVSASRLDPERTVVRVNPAGDRGQAADLDAVRAAGYRTVMLPKAEAVEQLRDLGGFAVIALCETPRGILAAAELAAAVETVGLMWGAEDLVAAMGGTSSRRPEGPYRDVARHARSAVLLAASAHGKLALDAVHLDIADLDGLRAEVVDAAASGFAGTACIHPAQVPVVREGFRPTPGELDWARRVLAASEHERGVFTFEGRMVDEPVLRHARSIRERAARRTELR